MEILPFSTDAIGLLLKMRGAPVARAERLGKRRALRRKIPGAVEMWVPHDDGTERHMLGHCHDLSERGVGVHCSEPLEVGATMPIATSHPPEASFYGTGTVRHCSKHDGRFLVGFELQM